MTANTNSSISVPRAVVRLLTFRSTREELLNVGASHLAFGLACTWLVGIGRYWDNPRVSLLQHFGVGSIVYIFVLALLLYVIVLPLRPKDWSYFRVLTFVSLVSPPAVLYAIPVERYFDLDTANTINVCFLGIVAAWRVALLLFYLRRFRCAWLVAGPDGCAVAVDSDRRDVNHSKFGSRGFRFHGRPWSVYEIRQR